MGSKLATSTVLVALSVMIMLLEWNVTEYKSILHLRVGNTKIGNNLNLRIAEPLVPVLFELVCEFVVPFKVIHASVWVIYVVLALELIMASVPKVPFVNKA